MPPKEIQARQAWSPNERDDIRNQLALHPGHSHQEIKHWFNPNYAPNTISKSQVRKILSQKRPQAVSASIPTQLSPTAE